MLALMFHLSIYYSLYNKNWSSIWYHFMGMLYEPIAVYPYLKEISFIMIAFKVY